LRRTLRRFLVTHEGMVINSISIRVCDCRRQGKVMGEQCAVIMLIVLHYRIRCRL
jgi:hypothetical protein